MTARIFTLILGAALLAAPFALADADGSGNRVIVIGNDGEHATVTLDGNHLQVVSVEDGDVSVHEIDFSHLSEIIDGAVSAAMEGLDEVFDEELNIRVDSDNMIHMSHGDQACAVNISVLAQELSNTLAEVHRNVGRELKHTRRVHHGHEQETTEDLKAELDQLRAELDRLKDELKDVH